MADADAISPGPEVPAEQDDGDQPAVQQEDAQSRIKARISFLNALAGKPKEQHATAFSHRQSNLRKKFKVRQTQVVEPAMPATRAESNTY
jgi:hypothetical protein